MDKKITTTVIEQLTFSEEPALSYKARVNVLIKDLESKQLPDGGWPAEDRFYQTTKPDINDYSPVNWYCISKHKMNRWVTVDALTVSGRVDRV